VHGDSAVADIDLAVRFLLPGQRVLHPLFVVAIGVVFAGVSTTRLLAVGGSFGGLDAERLSVFRDSFSEFAKALTRKSAGFAALGSRRGRNSRSCFDPSFQLERTLHQLP